MVGQALEFKTREEYDNHFRSVLQELIDSSDEKTEENSRKLPFDLDKILRWLRML